MRKKKLSDEEIAARWPSICIDVFMKDGILYATYMKRSTFEKIPKETPEAIDWPILKERLGKVKE